MNRAGLFLLPRYLPLVELSVRKNIIDAILCEIVEKAEAFMYMETKAGRYY